MRDLKLLAKSLGVTDKTMRAWVAAGCPQPRRGERTAAWRDRAMAWRAASRAKPGPIRLPGHSAAPPQDTKLQVQKLRRLELQNAQQEFEFERLRGNYWRKEEVEDAWARREFAVRQVLLQLPQVLAKRCAMAPAELIEEETRSIVHEVLEGFAEDGEFTPRSGAVLPDDAKNQP